MPMPIGKRFAKGYVTLSDRSSMQFRRIAEIMTARGDRMNHATARGIMLKGMEKIAEALLENITGSADPEAVKGLVATEAFQSYVGDVLDEGI